MGTPTQGVPKLKLRKGLWSPEEDEKLMRYITKYGHKCWSIVPKQAGLQRCGKSCRLRWINYLRPDLKRGHFSEEEEEVIIKLHAMLGNRWAQIATQLPGRTDNEIKNFWNSCLRKKLRQVGIDPNTHKPMLHLPVKLGAQIDTGEVLDSKPPPPPPPASSPPSVTRISDDQMKTFQVSQLGQGKGSNTPQQQQQQQQRTLTFRPMTFNTRSLNQLPLFMSQQNEDELQVFPVAPKGVTFKPEDSFLYEQEDHHLGTHQQQQHQRQSYVIGQSSPSDFSSYESSTETGCSETINPFPFWEACSNADTSCESWGFSEHMFSTESVLERIDASGTASGAWNHKSLPEFYEDEPTVSDTISLHQIM